MKKPLLLLRLCGALAICVTYAACSGAPSSAPAPSRAAAPVMKSTQMQQIQTEIGDAACDSADQCKTVAIGHKACGGPETYLAWSSKRSDGAKIGQLAAALEAERRSQTLRSGMISTCSVVVDPGAACSAGRCITGQQGNALAPVAR